MFWPSVANAKGGSFMPPQGSTIAGSVDALYEFLLIASLISCVLVIGGLIYFAWKYRRKTDNDKTAYISHNATLEFLWSFIPFVIFMIVFAWGWWIFRDMRTMPKDALEVHVLGQKWNWTFLYKSGRTSGGELYVPVGEPVKLIMTSKDVLHSFFIPGFRLKQDVLPGRYTALWFEATKVGTFQVFCTEYCGDKHSAMLAKLHVLSKEDYEEWLLNDPYKGMDLAGIGEKIYTSRCIACHKVTEERAIGPGFKGIIGRVREFTAGASITIDENYIRESILYPNKKIVKGYSPAMPTFQGQLSEQELAGVIEYLKSLK